MIQDQVSPPAAEAGEEKLTALDEMLKKRMSRRQSSAVDKENRKDRWGKLVDKAPVNDSRTQVVGRWRKHGYTTVPADDSRFSYLIPKILLLVGIILTK